MFENLHLQQNCWKLFFFHLAARYQIDLLNFKRKNHFESFVCSKNSIFGKIYVMVLESNIHLGMF